MARALLPDFAHCRRLMSIAGDGKDSCDDPTLTQVVGGGVEVPPPCSA